MALKRRITIGKKIMKNETIDFKSNKMEKCTFITAANPVIRKSPTTVFRDIKYRKSRIMVPKSIERKICPIPPNDKTFSPKISKYASGTFRE